MSSILFTQQELIGYSYLAAEKFLIILLTVFVAYFLIKLADAFFLRFFNITEFDPTLEKFAHRTLVTFLWILTLGVILVFLGVDVNAVVAGFGVGSFIVGFALKDTLGNFAAGIMILLNKPFLVHDQIEVKGVTGEVRAITASHTIIKTEEGNKVTLPNSLIWGNPITNYSGSED